MTRHNQPVVVASLRAEPHRNRVDRNKSGAYSRMKAVAARASSIR